MASRDVDPGVDPLEGVVLVGLVSALVVLAIVAVGWWL